MARSRASVELRRLLSSPAQVMSAADLAGALGISPQAVSNWLTGIARPRPELMARVEDIVGVPMRDWTVDVDDG